MKTFWLGILLACSASYGADYAFAPGCPHKYREAVRAALMRDGGDWRELKDEAWTPNVLHFLWTEWADWRGNSGTYGDIHFGSSMACWTALSSDTQWIVFTNAEWQNGKKKQYLNSERLDYELAIAKGK